MLKNKTQKLETKDNGFTLIELLVVIAIIGFLVTLAIVAFNTARAKARDAKRVVDIKQVQKALELYYNDCSQYPSTLATTANNGCPTGITLGTSLGSIPIAPTPQDGTCTAADNTYTYASTSPYSTYTTTFCLGGTAGALPSGKRTATPAGIN